METETNDLKDEEIWEKLLIKKEDTQRKLPEIARQLLNHVKIDLGNENHILFEKHITKVADKIKLLLISYFVLKNKEILNSESINIANIGGALSIKRTSLSKPLGILLKGGVIKKDSLGNYSIEHYKIKEILEEINHG